MNTRLLRKIQKAILADPYSFRMDLWSCGTAHCIGGYALVMSGGYNLKNIDMGMVNKPRGHLVEAFSAAKRELGLTSEQSHALFMTSGWPDDLYDKYEDKETEALNPHGDVTPKQQRAAQRACAKIAAERIERFIKTKGKE